MSYEEKLIKHYQQQKHREEVKSGHDTAGSTTIGLNTLFFRNISLSVHCIGGKPPRI